MYLHEENSPKPIGDELFYCVTLVDMFLFDKKKTLSTIPELHINLSQVVGLKISV